MLVQPGAPHFRIGFLFVIIWKSTLSESVYLIIDKVKVVDFTLILRTLAYAFSFESHINDRYFQLSIEVILFQMKFAWINYPKKEHHKCHLHTADKVGSNYIENLDKQLSISPWNSWIFFHHNELEEIWIVNQINQDYNW